MAFFIPGEQKIRPGVYKRYENIGESPVAGADNTTCAAVFTADWGPLNTPVLMTSFADVGRTFGEGGSVDVALEQFRGGAQRVRGIRMGTGGTEGSYEILDASSGPVVQLTLNYPGSRPFSVTVRPTLEDPSLNELLLLDGTTIVERVRFDATPDADQGAALIAAAQNSSFFTLTSLGASTDPLATVDQAPITPGTDPTVGTVTEYTNAFDALESYRWSVLSVDTSDPAILGMVQGFVNRVYEAGNSAIASIGEPISVPLETRIQNAASYNDYQMVYVGTGFVDRSGSVVDGYLAAARIAGMIASTPSSEAITRMEIAGAVGLAEDLSNHEYEQAILSGMLTFSMSAANTVWVEQGITTLVAPSGNVDAGWQKIKRVRVRFELFQRLTDTVEPLIGRINNNDDGRMTVIQLGNAVCNTMISENKLLIGARTLIDPENVPQGDSAWFLVYADDIDALEKMYFTFRFRFSPEVLNA